MATRKKVSKRSAKRAAVRASDKLAVAREKLARLEPGGSPERPIDVVSASLVEGQAKAAPCLRCLGETRVDDHTAATVAGKRLRLVNVICVPCGFRRTVYFRILANLLN